MNAFRKSGGNFLEKIMGHWKIGSRDLKGMK